MAWAGDTHAQQLFVHILRNRAANGMPLLTKMLPHFVPMLRKELCVRLKQKNVDGGIKLGLPKRPLYRVRFAQSRVWPDYSGAPGDTLDVELYEHWLEPAGEESA